MSSQSEPSTFDSVVLVPLVGRVLRSWLFWVMLLVGGSITGVISFVVKSVFESEAVLLYKDGGENPVGLQRDGGSPRSVGLTLQETLFSHSLLEKLVSEFGLYSKAVARYGVVAGVEELEKRDLRFSAREGFTFRIAFQSKSPELAQQVVARATDLLIQAHVESREREAKEIQQFLETERTRAEHELRARESELARLIAEHPEAVEIDGGRADTFVLDTTSPESASLGLELQALQLRQRLDQMRRRPAAFSGEGARAGGTSESNEAHLRAEAEVAAAQRDLAEKQAQFTEEYPEVKRARIRLAAAKALLRRTEDAGRAPTPAPTPSPDSSARAPASSDNSEAKLLQQQIELVEKQARAARSGRRAPPRPKATLNPEELARIRAQYVELERRARESRDHFDLLGNRHFQVEMQSLFTTQRKRGNLEVVDPAYKPVVPIRSPRSKVLIGGLVGSVSLAFFLCFFLVLRDDRLRGPEDLRRFRLPPLLCQVPRE